VHPLVGVDKMNMDEKIKWEWKMFGGDGVKVDGMMD